MGTRSLTYVMEGEKKVACLYRQLDGYISVHGFELAEFLTTTTLVNGLPPGKPFKLANGMGCLAGQIVARFKTRPGDFYLIPTEGKQLCGQEYEYWVHHDRVEVFKTICAEDIERKVIFNGTWDNFHAFTLKSE